MIPLKVNFLIPKADLKDSEWKTLNVRCNLNPDETTATDPEYSVAIPDFMFEELANTEPQFKTEHDYNVHNVSGCFSQRTITRKFQKTQTSRSIEMLKDYIYGLTKFIIEKHSIETETMNKKIFIKYNHSQTHCTSNLNSAYHGERVSQQFQYFIGYEVMTTKFGSMELGGGEKKPKKRYITKILYASPDSSLRKRDTGFKEDPDLFLPLPHHNQSEENFEKEFSIIDWTQERETYCENIKQAFIKLNTELSFFLKDLTTEKLDALMTKSNLLSLTSFKPEQ